MSNFLCSFLWQGTVDQKNLNLSVSETSFVLQISQPPKFAETRFCIQNLRVDLSFQEKKTIYKSVHLLSRYQANKVANSNKVSWHTDRKTAKSDSQK